MRDDRTDPNGDIRRCCDVDPRRVGAGVRLAQHARRLLKATIWYGLTAALDRLGLTLSTVQILCIDRSRGLVLVVDREAAALDLRPDTAEGIACWLPIAEVVGTLNNPALA